MRRRACPSTARGKEGAAPTPTTTPCRRAFMLLIALCNFTQRTQIDIELSILYYYVCRMYDIMYHRT